jgi:uncharacterized membrane protein
MKITEEKFNKLKQLDRIEYRQKEYNINNDSDDGLLRLFHVSIILSGIFTASFLVIKNLTGDINYNLFNIASLFLKVSVICFIIHYILSFISILIRHKKLKELQEQYFKIEVKK